MLESVRDLRKEREKLKELQNQKSEQRTAISHGDQRIARLENQLKEMRQVVAFDQKRSDKILNIKIFYS